MRRKKAIPPPEEEIWQLPEAYLGLTIAEIEKRPPATIRDFDISGLTRRVFRIEYETRLGELTGEDLGCMLGQKFSLELILPLVLKKLQADIMAEGYYEGHLALGVLEVPAEFWNQNPQLWRAFHSVIEPNKELLRAEGGRFELFLNVRLADWS